MSDAFIAELTLDEFSDETGRLDFANIQGEVTIDWGDGSGPITYTSGEISYQYATLGHTGSVLLVTSVAPMRALRWRSMTSRDTSRQ